MVRSALRALSFICVALRTLVADLVLLQALALVRGRRRGRQT